MHEEKNSSDLIFTIYQYYTLALRKEIEQIQSDYSCIIRDSEHKLISLFLFFQVSYSNTFSCSVILLIVSSIKSIYSGNESKSPFQAVLIGKRLKLYFLYQFVRNLGKYLCVCVCVCVCVCARVCVRVCVCVYEWEREILTCAVLTLLLTRNHVQKV